jgi:hypothetical protein
MDTPQNHKKKSEESPGDVVRNETASLANASGFPDSKESEKTVLIVDNPNYIPPNQIDILLSDIDSHAFPGDLSQRLHADYLSILSTEDETERVNQKRVEGKILEQRNTRFIINIPCRRRESRRNLPASPRAALPYRHIFFIVDTGSPHSFLCQEAMEALLDGNNDSNPVPRSMSIELIPGYTTEFHLSPPNGHHSDVNIIGGSVLQVTKVASDGFNKSLSLTFPSFGAT